ncbi:MAG: hypothetical protein ACOX6V_02770 [Patescibacteria group bacterium]|jgi:hypothetical protein
MKNFQSGSITAPLLVISAAFIVVIYGLVFLLTNQFDTTFRQTAFDQALYIAEAGIQYYRWHLAHAPEDFTDGMGQPGPYEHPYYDPQGEEIGRFSLEITPPTAGSTLVTITSTGWVTGYEAAKRTVTVSYGIPSLARYSGASEASMYYGSGITVNGLIHSNNGIRMDGTNTSLVTSARENYICGSETGCASNPTSSTVCNYYLPYASSCHWENFRCECPQNWSGCQSPCQWINGSGCQCPAIWGEGPNSNLWDYPEPPIDFEAINFDFREMSEAADTHNSHLGPATDFGSNNRGYHVVFNSSGTADVYLITELSSLKASTAETGCENWSQVITSQNPTPIRTFDLDTTPIIFLEDHIWVEGVVNGKTSLVAARFPTGTNNMDIWIRGNITYLEKNGQHKLGLIAQHDIYFTRDVPNDFEVDAALLAQNGKVIRHIYTCLCPVWYNPFRACDTSSQRVKNSLTIYGTLISRYKSYWNSGDPPSSGFITRTMTYDGTLLYNPPPYFPTQGEYEFISWKEE